MDTKEILLTAARSQNCSASLCDYSSSNILHYYKNGGNIAPKSLNLIGEDYLMSADEDKPILHVWPLNSQEPLKKYQTILPEKATTLAVCSKFPFIAAGIGAKLYIWNYTSGKLFSVQKRNYQPITCIKFSTNGNYVVIGGQDGRLIVYELIDLISLHHHMSQSDLGQVEPNYIKQDHVVAILDLYIGDFGRNSRLATVSLDQTCKIYNLETGQLLLNVIFNEIQTVVIFDAPCWHLYIGSNLGKISQFNLREPPRSLEYHALKIDNYFEGHVKRVTCLDINLTNTNLVSGSDDNFIYIWEIKSHQILRRIECKGGVTNVKFVLNYVNFSAQTITRSVVLKSLDRDLCADESFIDSKVQNYDIELSDSDEEIDDNSSNLQENNMLKVINRQLYDAVIKGQT